jgi:endonuclease/exonuclease/phosphatase family metal-dependent hydrolase
LRFASVNLHLQEASHWCDALFVLAVAADIFYLLISLKSHTMANLKLMIWNMEWMNDLFAGNGLFRPDAEKTQHNSAATVKQRRDALSTVIKELNPDILLVVEGPNVTAEWQLFLDTDLPGKWKGHIQNSPGMTQCIGIATRTDTGNLGIDALQTFDTLQIDAFKEWSMDLEDDGITEVYKFERSPLYAEIKTPDNKIFRLLGLHLKSKLVASALEWSRWWENADANRRKIFAQASRIRQEFLDAYLSDPATANIPLIVCGDINDGPGMDTSERKIMGSGIERLMGSVWFPQFTLGNALFDSLKPSDQRRLRFDKIATTSFADPIFNGTYHNEWIDHLLYSRNIAAKWILNAAAMKDLAQGSIHKAPYRHSSDHYPIIADIVL